MNGLVLVVIPYVLVIVISIFVTLYLIKKTRKKRINKIIEDLDKQKNIIEGTPVLAELSKTETIVKNNKMEARYKMWEERFQHIKENELRDVNDLIVDLDMSRESKYFNSKVSNIEISLAKTKGMMDELLDEIKEVNSSEEKYRSIVTKLKSKYRELNSIFVEHKDEYLDISDIIELQFENIEKRFNDFEVSMEKSEYNEVVHIVKAIDNMIDHMIIVIKEVPDLALLAEKLIPKRIEQVTKMYDDMEEKKYPIGYMNVPYNIEEILKNVNQIIDRIKVLNLENCMFELKTMLEYLDSMLNEFEKERNAKRDFEEESSDFTEKLEKVNQVVRDTYGQLDEIKKTYDLTDEDLKVIDDVNSHLESINNEYRETIVNLNKKDLSYSKALKIVRNLTIKLSSVDGELDTSLKSLGNMYDDEVRAREQLDEIQELLNQSKLKIKGYKLPIVANEYFVQLGEANEAILEIIKELSKKPISISTLNTRVDTARDLTLKLYNTTNEMVKTARLVEDAIVYGNRYRYDNNSVDDALNKAEMLFYKGSYKKALELSFEVLDAYDPSIKLRLSDAYDNER